MALENKASDEEGEIECQSTLNGEKSLELRAVVGFSAQSADPAFYDKRRTRKRNFVPKRCRCGVEKTCTFLESSKSPDVCTDYFYDSCTGGQQFEMLLRETLLILGSFHEWLGTVGYLEPTGKL